MFLNKSLATSVVLALSFSSTSFAGTLVDFKPSPVSVGAPEFIFNTVPGPLPSFKTGPGAIGNSDGVLPPPNQTAGGLNAAAPFLIPGVPGSALNVGVGSTEFFDSTLEFTGLVANAPAISFGGPILQSLGDGDFVLRSTDPDGPGLLLPQILLTGNIGSATFIVGSTNSGAAFNSSNVTYTGGLIYNALVASGANPAGNSMSFSMVDVTPSFSIAGSGYLANFSANGTGLFNFTPAVPEPASLALVAVALIGLTVNRRRN